MLKKYLLAAILLCSGVATAQFSEEIYGLNIGGNITNLRTNLPGYSTKAGTGFGIGVSVEKPIENNLSGFIHFNYEQRSFTANYQYSYDSGSATLTNSVSTNNTINVINIPLGLRYYFPNHDFYINAGGFAETYQRRGNPGLEVPSALWGQNSYSLGLFPGAGYRLELSEEDESDLLFEIRYTIGLKNFADDAASKMNCLSLSVSYRIGSVVF